MRYNSWPQNINLNFHPKVKNNETTLIHMLALTSCFIHGVGNDFVPIRTAIGKVGDIGHNVRNLWRLGISFQALCYNRVLCRLGRGCHKKWRRVLHNNTESFPLMMVHHCQHWLDNLRVWSLSSCKCGELAFVRDSSVCTSLEKITNRNDDRITKSCANYLFIAMWQQRK